MPFFKIQYQIDPGGLRRYPACVGGVVWNHCAYHPADPWMIGQTETAFTPDGKDATAINDADATELLAQWAELVSKQASAAELRATPKPKPAAKPKAKNPSVKRSAGTKAATGMPNKK